MPTVEGRTATIRPAVVHEIKHDAFRLMVRREGSRVRCFTKGGYDWADRFPVVEAASRLKASSFLIDGEAVIVRDDGHSDFDALRSRRRDHEAMLFAFDLIEHQGDDLRDLPLEARKQRLASLLVKAASALSNEELFSYRIALLPLKGATGTGKSVSRGTADSPGESAVDCKLPKDKFIRAIAPNVGF